MVAPIFYISIEDWLTDGIGNSHEARKWIVAKTYNKNVF